MSQEWLRHVVQPGMTCVDVGANVGDYTAALLALVGPTGRVIAIEPCADTVRQGLSRCHDGVWIRAAVWDTVKPTVLHRSQRAPHHSLWRANVLEPTPEQEVVEGVTLDHLQAERLLPAQIDFIKVDAQGAEGAILAGAKDLLAKRQTAWLLELWPAGLAHAGTSTARVCQQLADARLIPWTVQGQRLVEQTWGQVETDAQQHHQHSSMDILARPV